MGYLGFGTWPTNPMRLAIRKALRGELRLPVEPRVTCHHEEINHAWNQPFRNGTVDRRNPANQLVGSSLSQYSQGFIHPRWCRISSIKSIVFCMAFFGNHYGSPHVANEWNWWQKVSPSKSPVQQTLVESICNLCKAPRLRVDDGNKIYLSSQRCRDVKISVQRKSPMTENDNDISGDVFN